MTLFRRILVEKRSLVAPLALALLVNLGAYVLVVYPLGARSANSADRAAAAAQALQDAQRDYNAARNLVTGKSKADQELTTFYKQVLPPDESAARLMTYAWVPALASQANVQTLSRHQEPEERRDRDETKGSQFGRLKMRVILQGDYEGVRRFLYALETAPQFVIIDDVSLVQAEANKPLTLTLELSTYYRLGADGT